MTPSAPGSSKEKPPPPTVLSPIVAVRMANRATSSARSIRAAPTRCPSRPSWLGGAVDAGSVDSASGSGMRFKPSTSRENRVASDLYKRGLTNPSDTQGAIHQQWEAPLRRLTRTRSARSHLRIDVNRRWSLVVNALDDIPRSADRGQHTPRQICRSASSQRRFSPCFTRARLCVAQPKYGRADGAEGTQGRGPGDRDPGRAVGYRRRSGVRRDSRTPGAAAPQERHLPW